MYGEPMLMTEIKHRNEQYRRLMMSKNKDGYAIYTRENEAAPYVKRMEALSPDYLDSVGRRWVSGKFCLDYEVREK